MNPVARLLAMNGEELQKLAHLLVQKEEENQTLREKVASLEKERECSKLAAELISSGKVPGNLEDVTQSLVRMPDEKVAAYKAALELSGADPYGRFQIRSEESPEAMYQGVGGRAAAAALDNFVSGG